eukprot:GEMP01074190.1.p1 GENE.GEMP01074190.1~~GEMP01074190.1.p1  ORF type:complete len:119 (-),score=2.25 GEMP01074190.1:59-415(-)
MYLPYNYISRNMGGHTKPQKWHSLATRDVRYIPHNLSTRQKRSHKYDPPGPEWSSRQIAILSRILWVLRRTVYIIFCPHISCIREKKQKYKKDAAAAEERKHTKGKVKKCQKKTLFIF